MRTVSMAKPVTWQMTSPVRSRCPRCDAQLTILRVIAGRAGAEYWALQCTSCHGVHLDIVEPPTRH
jgi:Transcription factor zinc-finger